MKKMILLLGAVGAMMFTSGCTQHLGNFTALSSSSFRGENISEKYMVKANAEGETCSMMILGFPINGIPKIDQAVAEALSKNNGDFMANAKLYSKAWYFLLFGQACYVVNGDVYKTSK